MKRLLIISCLIVSVLMTGCRSSQLSPVTLRVSNVSRQEAVNTLWEHGNTRFARDLFERTKKKVWESSKDIDKPKAIVKYNLRHFFSGVTKGKDTINVTGNEPNDILMSLSCEDKNVPFLHPSFFHSYSRNYSRERYIMYDTATELLARNAHVIWEGDFQVSNYPLLKSNETSLWMAFEMNSPSKLHSFFENKNYLPVKANMENEWIYIRTLDRDPSLNSNFFDDIFEPVLGERWKSNEKAIVKFISNKNDIEKSIVAIGITAKGAQHKWFLIVHEYIDVSNQMKEKLLDDLTRMVLVNSEKIVFKDPAPWMENITLP